MGALLSNQGGISESEFLLDSDPTGSTGAIDCTYTPTYTLGLVTLEEWRRDDATLLKSHAYTYTLTKVTTEVRKVFALDGTTIVAQVTWTYSYTGNIVTSATMIRNV